MVPSIARYRSVYIGAGEDSARLCGHACFACAAVDERADMEACVRDVAGRVWDMSHPRAQLDSKVVRYDGPSDEYRCLGMRAELEQAGRISEAEDDNVCIREVVFDLRKVLGHCWDEADLVGARDVFEDEAEQGNIVRRVADQYIHAVRCLSYGVV